jgi:acyl-coenzyme A thioesterase PaaI-like protein
VIYRNNIPWLLSGDAAAHGLDFEIHWDGSEAVVHQTPARILQGAPGVAHGGYLAAIADQVMAFVAAEQSGRGVMTQHMALDYVAPTPISRPLTLRACAEEVTDRKVTVVLHSMASGQVTFRARGVYAKISSSHSADDADYDSLEERFDPSQVFVWLTAAMKRSYAPREIAAPLLIAVDVSDAQPSHWTFEAATDSLQIQAGEPDAWDVRFTGNVRAWRELMYRVKTAEELSDAGSATVEDPRGLLASFLDSVGN